MEIKESNDIKAQVERLRRAARYFADRYRDYREKVDALQVTILQRDAEIERLRALIQQNMPHLLGVSDGG